MRFSHVITEINAVGEQTYRYNFEIPLVLKHSIMFLMLFLSFLSNYLKRNKLCILVKVTVASNSHSDLEY